MSPKGEASKLTSAEVSARPKLVAVLYCRWQYQLTASESRQKSGAPQRRR